MISPLWRLVFGSLFSLLTIVGLCGNALVIVAILGDRKMRRSVMNLLLLNLAIADALNLATTSLEWTPTIALGSPTWIPWLPYYLCPVVRYFECVFLFTSILTQLMVCIERYIAIVFPIHARRLCSRTNILIAIFTIWLTACLIAVPYVLHNKISPDGTVCINVRASSEFWNKWFEFLTLYLLPCLAFLFLYSKICAVLWAKNRQLYEVPETKTSLSARDEPRLSDPGSAASRTSSTSAALLGAREEALRTRRNVVKMLVACVSVYFVCYSPIQAIFLSRGLFNVRIHPPYQFILLMNALAMLCSACNPLLYTLFSRRFRTRIAALLCPILLLKKFQQ
uniref:G-protein coupled receptors family 1 profile domain-containing protein n=1 Tax=Meloidogyne enterolobii TaxID=390850 RepID=A0A6V7XB82_MELEN|nr:unnamed protein product [Meloidogyne enterolobii]CAD2207543.1 unnamed protein product [Meloidogyne enterolobii]